MCSLCGSSQRVRLGEPKRTTENPGPPRNTPKPVNLVSGLYFRTESALKVDCITSYYFPVNTDVRHGCVLAPTHPNTCMVHVPKRISKKSGCGLSFGAVRITDLDFADHAVIIAQTTELLAGALDLLSDESEPLGLRVS